MPSATGAISGIIEIIPIAAAHAVAGAAEPTANPRGDTGGGTRGNEPAMSWTQPARQGTGQAQLTLGAFEAAPPGAAPPAPPPAVAAPPAAAPASGAPAPAAPTPPASPPQVVWSSAPEPKSWHSDVRNDE